MSLKPADSNERADDILNGQVTWPSTRNDVELAERSGERRTKTELGRMIELIRQRPGLAWLLVDRIAGEFFEIQTEGGIHELPPGSVNVTPTRRKVARKKPLVIAAFALGTPATKRNRHSEASPLTLITSGRQRRHHQSRGDLASVQSAKSVQFLWLRCRRLICMLISCRACQVSSPKWPI